jgi:hypothetical protein
MKALLPSAKTQERNHNSAYLEKNVHVTGTYWFLLKTRQ